MSNIGPKIIITVEEQYPSEIQFIPPPPKTKWQNKQLQDLIKRTSLVGRILTSTPTNNLRRDSDDRFPSARSISSIASRAQTTTSSLSRPQTAGTYRPVLKEPTKIVRPKSALEPKEIKQNIKPAVGLGMIHRLFEIWEPQMTKSYRKPAVQGEDDRCFRRRRRRMAKLNMAVHLLGKSKSRSLSKGSIYSNY
ncbi:unnamed protein product [Mytilus coruscus]|uniref:Uncharacterized protein n=1 Tax=Mytilus coruscus TaxID=42192 RepID=A0A6J8CEA1_MYTCO|nr:unnamed protein product [Mytilus coruscus]